MDQPQEIARLDIKNLLHIAFLVIGMALFVLLGVSALTEIGNTTYTEGVTENRQIASRP